MTSSQTQLHNANVYRNKLLADELVERGFASFEEINRAQSLTLKAGHLLEQVLTELGIISEEELAEFLANWLELSFISLSEHRFDPASFPDLNLAFLKSSNVLPLRETETTLEIAVSDPRNPQTVEMLEYKLGKKVSVTIAEANEISRILANAATESREGVTSKSSDADERRLQQLANDGPAIRIVNELLGDAMNLGASDIHLEAQERGSLVRLRVDGRLKENSVLSLDDAKLCVSRIKLMANLNIAEKRLPQDGQIVATVRGRTLNVRCSTLPTQFGESVVLRLLDNRNAGQNWVELGYSEKHQVQLNRLFSHSCGIVLVSGPTGSGKTTTLYSAVRDLNQPDTKIVTVEDPIEYSIEGVNQVQINTELGLGFAEVLRSVLRQDPDVVMLGEIRDRETAEHAVRAALMGRLVLSTVHTNSAASAIDRLLDLGIPAFLLSSTIRGIVSQRELCPKVGDGVIRRRFEFV